MADAKHVLAARMAGQFEAFYRQEYSRLVALLYALTGNRWAAEDLAQEAFLRANRDWAQVGGMDVPGAWVRRVAMNLAMSRFRRLRAESNAKNRLVPGSVFGPVHPEYEGFWAEVRRLPKRQAQAVALRYVEDMSVREVAEVLAIAEGTVKALLHQARRRLEPRLVEKGWIDNAVR